MPSKTRTNPLRPVCIYHVLDQHGKPVYVGITKNGLNTRMAAHRCEARRFMRGYWARDPYPFMTWLMGELEAGRDPQIVFAKWCGDDWQADEQREIKRLLRRGCKLLNVQ